MMSKRDKVHTRRPAVSTRQAAGFTLVELMVTLAVLIILLAIGVPQMRTFLLKRQVAADMESLSSALQLARSEALKRSGPVSICPLAANTTNCVTPAGRDWSHGWKIFIDEKDPDNPLNPFDANLDTEIKIEERTRNGAISLGTSMGKLTFLSNGLLNSNAGTFTIQSGADVSSGPCKVLAISKQGRMKPGACEGETQSTTPPTTPNAGP